jgi:hypothetical protein
LPQNVCTASTIVRWDERRFTSGGAGRKKEAVAPEVNSQTQAALALNRRNLSGKKLGTSVREAQIQNPVDGNTALVQKS